MKQRIGLHVEDIGQDEAAGAVGQDRGMEGCMNGSLWREMSHIGNILWVYTPCYNESLILEELVDWILETEFLFFILSQLNFLAWKGYNLPLLSCKVMHPYGGNSAYVLWIQMRGKKKV